MKRVFLLVFTAVLLALAAVPVSARANDIFAFEDGSAITAQDWERDFGNYLYEQGGKWMTGLFYLEEEPSELGGVWFRVMHSPLMVYGHIDPYVYDSRIRLGLYSNGAGEPIVQISIAEEVSDSGHLPKDYKKLSFVAAAAALWLDPTLGENVPAVMVSQIDRLLNGFEEPFTINGSEYSNFITADDGTVFYLLQIKKANDNGESSRFGAEPKNQHVRRKIDVVYPDVVMLYNYFGIADRTLFNRTNWQSVITDYQPATHQYGIELDTPTNRWKYFDNEQDLLDFAAENWDRIVK